MRRVLVHDLDGIGFWPRENDFNLKCKNLDDITGYLINFCKIKVKKINGIKSIQTFHLEIFNRIADVKCSI